MEDFVRWHSPPDWTDMELDSKAEITSDDGDLLSARGQLSSRMQKEGYSSYFIIHYYVIKFSAE